MYRITNKSAAIRRVQSMLRTISFSDADFTKVPKDGIFESETKDAVMLFQTKNALPTTGRVDYQTFVRLRDTSDALREGDAEALMSLPLHEGMQGTDVRMLHVLLEAFIRRHPGMFRVPTTSYFSRETARAVRELRSFFVLPASDIADGQLISRLRGYLVRCPMRE